MGTEKRFFHFGDILSVTTDYLLSPRKIGGVYDILNFLTGDNLFTHQLGRAAERAKPYLLGEYPEPLVILTGLTHEAKRSLGEEWGSRCENWLIGLCSKHGDGMEIAPMPAGQWLRIDPLKELSAMVGEERIIPVITEAPNAEPLP